MQNKEAIKEMLADILYARFNASEDGCRLTVNTIMRKLEQLIPEIPDMALNEKCSHCGEQLQLRSSVRHPDGTVWLVRFCKCGCHPVTEVIQLAGFPVADIDAAVADTAALHIPGSITAMCPHCFTELPNTIMVNDLCPKCKKPLVTASLLPISKK